MGERLIKEGHIGPLGLEIEVTLGRKQVNQSGENKNVRSSVELI